MKRHTGSDFIFQVFALLLSIIIVHAVYVSLIRPTANAILEEQLALQASGQAYVAQRSMYVVLRDYEQEACFILMLWAMAIMGLKARNGFAEQKLLEQQLLPIDSSTSVLPEDTRALSRNKEILPLNQRYLLVPRVLLAALQRFGATHDIGDAANVAKEVCDGESDRLDSELAMVRYIAWAIPSIGFIGTVRGIGEALGQAHRAVEGDIAGVTVSLGVAFNSTFVALVISIIIMFFTHQLQLLQERLVLNAQNYCDEKLLKQLKTDK